MRKQLFRLSLAAFAISMAASPAVAGEAGCPGHLTNGSIACHNTQGTDCSSCTYRCDNGGEYRWNVCDIDRIE